MLEPLLDATLHSEFDVYDLDRSGTINSYIEMQQFTLNLLTTLEADGEIPGGKDGILKLISSFKDPYLERHPMSLAFYAVWFT